MSKLYQVLPRGFFCLVAVLLVLSALAVPSRDAHSDEPIACGPGNGSNTDCPDGYVCDGQYCVAPIDCSMAACQVKDENGGCTPICIAKKCTGGQDANSVCAKSIYKDCKCLP
jgi:hypothetical protein